LIDDSRTVLAMTGADVRDVLQNIVTNDVDRLAAGRAVYAALLTPQGKYLFDFVLLDGSALGRPEGSVLIDVAANRAEALAQRLKMYCLRRDAKMEGATDLAVGLIWGGDADPAIPDAAVVPDPRDAALGWRAYGRALALPDTIAPAAMTDYDALRVARMVPQTGIELVPDDTYILEAGFERLAGVDFRKGCYVGQEVTARMKHKTELRKGLVRVEVAGDAPPGTPVTAGGKPAGTLFTVAGGQGLAHLRLDRAGEEMEAGAARVSYRG
jgi:folate-binding protein YgfZ